VALAADLGGYETTGYENTATLSARGDHFQALLTFSAKSADSLSNADRLAAARSAWSLGLVDRARTLWDEVLADTAIDKSERARLLLSRAMLELQEGQYEQARAFSEEGARKLEQSDLRAQFWLVIAESLREQGIHSAALAYYEKAAAESATASKSESSYLLGECQARLGQLSQARQSFTAIPISAPPAAKGLRRLIELDLRDGDFQSTLTWLKEGYQSFPAEFDDPWLSYAKVISLVGVNQAKEARLSLASFKAKFSADNSWYQLAEAAVVAHDFTSSQLPEPDSLSQLESAKPEASKYE